MSSNASKLMQHCWRSGQAPRLSLLVDGSEYFGALREALLSARQAVYILGWDVDSRTRITGEDREPDDGAPAELRPLLNALVKRSPELKVRILLWDYSVLYSLERELLPKIALGWRTPDRVDVALDSEFPIGASQHYKLVVIDDKLAFVGGLDLTIRRWDTPEHRADDPRRVDPDGEPYAPFHDLQVVLDGEPARALADYCRDRWHRATGSEAQPVETDADPWPASARPGFSDVRVGIARTVPEYEDQPESREIEACYLQAISGADRFIYVENQYITAQSVAEALINRLQQHEQLEVLVVCPRAPGGWLEAKTMGAGRERVMAMVAQAGLQDRFRFMEPVVDGRDGPVPVMVHAKLMIVDERVMLIGSANLNNRSMGFDSECNLTLDCNEQSHCAVISATRRRLLAEHCGVDETAIDEIFDRAEPRLPALEKTRGEQRRLETIDYDVSRHDDLMASSITELADPEAPIDPADYLGDSFGGADDPQSGRQLWIILAVVLGAAALWAAWEFTPLGRYADPQRLAGLFEALGNPWAKAAVIVSVFVLGGLLFFPVTALVAATGILLGPWMGFGAAFLGTLLSAATSFFIGRRLHPSVARWIPQATRRVVNRALNQRAVLAVAVIRNVPIAPFSAVNLLAGQTEIGILPFLAGTAVGMAPGISLLTVMGDRLRVLWTNPSIENVLLLAGIVVAWLLVVLGLQALANRTRQGQSVSG